MSIDEQQFYTLNKKQKFESGTLIFCPHKSPKSAIGVEAVAPQLRIPEARVGTFFGGDERLDKVGSSVSEVNQTKFIANDLNILVATKAFGMGIDKSNIRSTVHINFPGSIEAFVERPAGLARIRNRQFVPFCIASRRVMIER
ncbi:MAG: hypothetical protein IPJ06_00625 [Saprospiraceae bacterium]|nr:hypothetical protein [Saprospiraceae bacterium]